MILRSDPASHWSPSDVEGSHASSPDDQVPLCVSHRFACVVHFNPIEPDSELNGHHGHHLNRHPKLSFRQIPTQSCPCPVNESWKRTFRSVQTLQLCSESQARNYSDSHNEHHVVGVRDHYLSGRLAAQRRFPNDTQTSTRLVKERKTKSR